MGWREKATRAKRLHRPTLKNWECDGLASTFPAYESAILSNDNAYCSCKISNGVMEQVNWSVDDYRANNGGGQSKSMMIPVVLDAKYTPIELFHSEYEAKCIPVVIRDIPYGVVNQQGQVNDNSNTASANGQFQEEKKECDDSNQSNDVMNCDNDPTDNNNNSSSKPWAAVNAWSFPSLYNDPLLRSRLFKVGEDDDGTALAALLETAAAGINLDRFAAARNLTAPDLDILAELVPMRTLPTAAGRLAFSEERWDGVRAAVLAGLAAWHAKNPDTVGPGENRVLTGTGIRLPGDAAAAIAAARKAIVRGV